MLVASGFFASLAVFLVAEKKFSLGQIMSKVVCETGCVMTIKMNTNQQLELGLRGTPPRRSRKPAPARLARAQWWFARMREAVGTAMDWNLDPAMRNQPMFVSDQEKVRA
jgi:hypothetical protein